MVGCSLLRHPPNLSNALLSFSWQSRTAERRGDDVFIMAAREIKPYSRRRLHISEPSSLPNEKIAEVRGFSADKGSPRESTYCPFKFALIVRKF